jgi:hypothetical protein
MKLTEEQTVIAWSNLVEPEEIKNQIQSYKIVTDAAMQLIFSENLSKKSEMERNGHYLFQMTSLKCLSVLKLVQEKTQYRNDISGFTMQVYDPFSLEPVVRSQFEAFAHFNNIFINSHSDEDKQLKYNVWAICGLMNRQKFAAIQAESLAKKASEKKEIDAIEKQILNNKTFKSLNSDSQKEILKRIERSDWKLTIKGNVAVFPGWQKLSENAGTNSHMKDMYRRFSLYAHPSYVSVFQFRDAYEKGNETADFFTEMILKFSKFYMSLLIADYCKFSPEAKKAFNEMPELHQLLVNYYNKMFRGNSFQINNLWDKFNPIMESVFKKHLEIKI